MKNVWNFFLFLVITFVLSSCASSPRFTAERHSEPKYNSSKTPAKSPSGKATVYTGIASYYAHDFHGKKTANGEIFDMHQLTAAHRSFPFNTKVRVTNLDNGKTCVVRVNDRGPFKLERIMDLSLGAAEVLDMMKTGTASVQLEVVEWGSE
ncbi:MAG: septal ring lytic transglycosylase RlpA family protein [Bacteroidota bacterium]|nr:septal ring lytic transglycosylase RlpA family protein [Bacteroidota bacterium]